MYVCVEQDLVLDLSQVVVVTGAGGAADAKPGERETAPRTFIHLADGRTLSVRTARETVVRKIREAHL